MISINKEKCIGCGNCASVCSEVFEIKDGKSRIKKGQENSKKPCVKEAVQGCPVDAIKIK